jgi:hypothetical protein
MVVNRQLPSSAYPILQKLKESNTLSKCVEIIRLWHQACSIHLYHIIHANRVYVNEKDLLGKLNAGRVGLAAVGNQAARVVVLKEGVETHTISVDITAIINAKAPSLDAFGKSLAPAKIWITPGSIWGVSKSGNGVILHVSEVPPLAAWIAQHRPLQTYAVSDCMCPM